MPEVMESVARKGGVMRPRVVLAKFVGSAITIGTGGSAGREGPIVQIGAAIGSVVGQFLRVSAGRVKTYVGCGAAAGIAATFNAPLAGALFAVEIILGDFAIHQFSPIVIASVIGTVVSRHFLGDFPGVSATGVFPGQPLGVFSATSPWALPPPSRGLIFMKTLYWFEDRFDDAKFIPRASTSGHRRCAGGLYRPLVPPDLRLGIRQRGAGAGRQHGLDAAGRPAGGPKPLAPR